MFEARRAPEERQGLRLRRHDRARCASCAPRASRSSACRRASPTSRRRANAIEAAHQAALAGDTKYPPQDGQLALKEAIAAQVQARQRSRLRARRDHGRQRQQADHVRRSHGEREPGRRGDHPGARLDQLCRPGQAVAGGVPVPVSCPENNQFKLRAGRSRGRDHAEDQVGGAELPQQSDRRGAARAPRCARSPTCCCAIRMSGHGRRHVRAPALRRLRLLHRSPRSSRG